MRALIEDIPELQKRFFDTAIADILRAMDGGSLVGAFVLTLCVIDYLSCLKFGDEGDYYKDNKRYKEFIEKYLNRVREKRGLRGYDKDFCWSFRNALLHTYGYSRIMRNKQKKQKKQKKYYYQMTHLNPEVHYEEIRGSVWLNLEDFVTDVIWCANNFFTTLLDTEKQSVLSRGNELLRVQNAPNMQGRAYASMHPSLRAFNSKIPNYDYLYHDIGSFKYMLAAKKEIEKWYKYMTNTLP